MTYFWELISLQHPIVFLELFTFSLMASVQYFFFNDLFKLFTWLEVSIDFADLPSGEHLLVVSQNLPV